MSGIALTRWGDGDDLQRGASIWKRTVKAWNRTFETRRRKVFGVVAGAVALAVLGAFINWQVDLVQAWLEVGDLNAANNELNTANNVQQAEIASLQFKVGTLDASNKELARKLASADGVKSGLCKAMLSAADSGQFSPPSAVSDICGIVPIVAVKRPRAGDRVGMATEVAGTADVRALNGRTIWFALSTPGIPGFYMQGRWPNAGPAQFTVEGTWTSPGLFVGGPNDIGKQFDIVIILADKSAAREFWNILQHDSKIGSYPPIAQLPAGAREFTRVNVIRD